jgi:cellulose synthase/poly-beta-1,6-N-acetylglucosamine synthase-like glycosyltransferase
MTILIPAHNEESVIENTLLSLDDEVTENDQVVVIADNCVDETETIVRNLGFEVIVREDLAEVGKGYALGFGIDHIEQKENQPDALVILDADCTVTRGSLKELAAIGVELKRPAQAQYLMHANPENGIGQRVAEFAWIVKGKVRSTGYRKLGLPCQLKGTGMAFPWGLVDADKFRSANIVEDLELGIQLTLDGYPPFYCPEVTVSSEFPLSKEGEKSQRKRWEHGHLATSLKFLPKLVKQCIAGLDVNCAALAADLLVPPLALLAILLVVLNVFCGGYALVTGITGPLWVSLSLLGIFGLGVLIAWFFHAREVIGLKHLLFVPVYVIRKIPLYLTILVKRQVKWVKTSRGNQSGGNDE